MKEMVNIVPKGSCPNCGHSQFVVSELQINEYLTNRDGEIIDSLDIEYDAEGYCMNCKERFKMYPTREGFIPLTRLRAILLHSTHMLDSLDEPTYIPNPMEVK